MLKRNRYCQICEKPAILHSSNMIGQKGSTNNQILGIQKAPR